MGADIPGTPIARAGRISHGVTEKTGTLSPGKHQLTREVTGRWQQGERMARWDRQRGATW